MRIAVPAATLPVVDIAPMLGGADRDARERVAADIGEVCGAHGFSTVLRPGLHCPGHAAAAARPDRPRCVAADRSARWDGASVLAPFDGTYGDYLLQKVGKVFPQLCAGLA